MNVNTDAGLAARPSETWQLIDHIYATGQHPQHWPILLEAISRVFVHMHNRDHTQGDQISENLMSLLEDDDKVSLDKLSTSVAKHLFQALALNQHINEQLNLLTTVEPLLASLSFPLLVVDKDLKVIYVGDRYSEYLHSGSSIFVQDGMLILKNPGSQEVIGRILAGKSAAEMLVAERNFNGESPSKVYALPLSVDKESPLLLIAWFSVDDRARRSCEDLAKFYLLTKAETSLLTDLMRERSYAELAIDRHVTEHTIRSQVKQIFAKTDSHSRAELVQKVLCGPELLNKLVASPIESFLVGSTDESRRSQRFKLANGRQFGFAEYGPKEGIPVILIHNVMGSRLQLPTPEKRFYEQGIRLIMPDRPGIGLSDAPNASLMTYWNEAYEQLIDYLKLERALVVGTSMGGVYAMSAAAAMPERFERLSLVSTMAELDYQRDALFLEDDLRKLLYLKQLPPQVSRFLLQLAIRDAPHRYLERRIQKLPKADQIMYLDPGFYEMSVAALKENFQQGAETMRQDFLFLIRAWNFPLENIHVPVQCWHGSLDIASPMTSVIRLVEHLPDCQTIFIPEETHMLIYRHWNAVIANLLHPSLITDKVIAAH